jgi:MoxR-like ATPase
MYSANFDYHRARSLADVHRLLAANPGAKLLAGGHSLIPLMKLRLASPPTVVDIGRIPELRGISRSGDAIRIGALTTHAEIAASADVQKAALALAEAAGLVGDPAVRSRGTIGGNIAHADPASDLPTVLVALDARIVVVGPSGERTIAADGFFTGIMTTMLADDEVVSGLTVRRHRCRGIAHRRQQPVLGGARRAWRPGVACAPCSGGGEGAGRQRTGCRGYGRRCGAGCIGSRWRGQRRYLRIGFVSQGSRAGLRQARDRRSRRARRPRVSRAPLAMPPSVDALQEALGRRQYIAERPLAVSIYLALRLKRPLFLEGEAGVGKTEVAKVLAAALDTSLIRLQCYEGLDVSQAVYEWNYPRQLLEIRMIETARDLDRAAATHELFSDTFLIKRPLLRAIEQTGHRPPVLLIDEIDRADEEFEGYLLEFLSEFQVTIPELGTIRAADPPIVVITSNRTREVHDALKRRCVYSWIPYPDFEKEYRIVTAKVPDASERLARQVTAFVQDLRTADLYKAAGISETLDWAAALVALDRDVLDRDVIDETLGILLKNQEDIDAVRGERVGAILARVLA